MLLTPNEEIADRVRYLATQARQPAVHYEHTEVGFNYRLSNLLAALGRGQFARLPSFVERRRAINDRYRELLADVEECDFMPVPEWSDWNGWLSCVVFAVPGVSHRVHNASLGSEIESLSAVEADAPSAGVRRVPVAHGCDERSHLRSRPVPAERECAHRRPGGGSGRPGAQQDPQPRPHLNVPVSPALRSRLSSG